MTSLIDAISQVTAIMVNCDTLRLTRPALTSFLRHYPTLHTIVVDNGSADGSVEYISHLGPPVTSMLLSTNIGHGPALHAAIQHITTPYFFTLDSDTITRRGGFIEPMVSIFNDDTNLFALGAFSLSDFGATRSGTLPTVHPSAMMVRRSLYLLGRPFVHAGQPVHLAMADARERSNRISGFPICDYIDHLGGGTRHVLRSKQRLSHHTSTTVPLRTTVAA